MQQCRDPAPSLKDRKQPHGVFYEAGIPPTRQGSHTKSPKERTPWPGTAREQRCELASQNLGEPGPAVRAKGSHPDGAHSRGPIGRGRVCTGCGAEGPRGAPDPDGGGTVGTVGCVNHQTRHAVHSKQLGSHPSHCASESGYDALRTARPGLPCGRRGGRTSRSPALRAGVRVAGGPLAAPARGDLCLTGLLGS